MAQLPSSGEIKLSDIRNQLGLSSKTDFSLDKAENGDVSFGYPTINQCSPSKPSDTDPCSFSEWYSYNHLSSCVSNSFQAVYCNYTTDICALDYGTTTPPQTPSTSTSYIGTGLLDIYYGNTGVTQYNYRLYISTSGMSENGQYVEDSLTDSVRHVPTNSTSATTSYIIAGTKESVFNTSARGNRFGINLVYIMQQYPSISVFTFDLYGARILSSGVGNTFVSTAVKHSTLVNVSDTINNGIDFSVTIAESTSPAIEASKICAAVNSYVKLGYFTYNKAADTLIYTNLLSNLSCTPV
jgi:hypothetical protein